MAEIGKYEDYDGTPEGLAKLTGLPLQDVKLVYSEKTRNDVIDEIVGESAKELEWKSPSVVIRIREVSTGEEVDCIEDVEEQYLDNQDFYYGEGNGSCDCNRKLMFGRAKGVEFSDEETPCGSTRYRARVIVKGKIVLDELGS
jgi:hypothetical protein